ncbi:hypothetical protein [Actinoplanes ianthinogenes]|uniref:hypothetical protein n=1 Tax=Actinoplanes ianthinogenes TaxID=122358 RepID=UPI001670B2C8|nr:hypothetical protein [Actinoplanes ianthinogenes]
MSRDGAGPRHAAEWAEFTLTREAGLIRIVGPGEFVLQLSMDRVRDLLPKLRAATEPGGAWLELVGIRFSGAAWEDLLSQVEAAASPARGDMPTPPPPERTSWVPAEPRPEPVSRIHPEPPPERTSWVPAEPLADPAGQVHTEPPPLTMTMPSEPETPAASRVKVFGPEPAEEAPPPPPIRGPELSPDALDSGDWLILCPLPDTLALSRGELLRPPDSR